MSLAMGRVAVLMGGMSGEREISLRSGRGVLAALQRRGIDVLSFDPAERPLHQLLDEGVQRVFIALHGRFGEDGTVQGALELLGIPYTGSGVLASSLAMDKVMTKRLWMQAGLPTPRFQRAGAHVDAMAVVHELGLPLAIKPICEGSSLGFHRVDHATGLAAALHAAAQVDRDVMIEQFVEGREFTCALLQNAEGVVQPLPLVEIVAPGGRYDYQNKYFGDATRYLCPAPLPEALASRMQAISVAAFDDIGCSGWARVDLMWDGAGDPMLLEINTSPGMTDHSLVPMAASEAGMDYDTLVMNILAGAALKTGRAGQ